LLNFHYFNSTFTNEVGEIVLCYVKPVRAEKGIFLSEELRLFKTLVEKINQYLTFRKLKEIYSENVDKKKRHNKNEENFISYLKGLYLTDEEISKITKVQIDFKKGETVCKQGSFASFIMILKDGLLKAFTEASHYKNHIFKITTPYNIIGLSSLYGDNYYHFSCQALASSKVCLVERSTFDEIVKTNSKFSIEIMKIYSNSLQNVYDKLGSVANKQALGKVCDTLVYLSEKVFKSHTIETSITRKDIAEFSGLATENLVRILSELKKDKIIAINNKTIEILDLNKLRMLGDLG
jgi:CRP-like cAMP-binding protein